MVESDGVSVGSVLDEILSPSRMLGWKVAPVIAAGPPPSVSALQIVPFTRAASAISLPSVGSLPANADVSTFASVGDPLTDVAVDVDSSEAVDQVVVQGPREIGVGTLRPSEHTPAWKTSDQLDYDDAFSNDPGWNGLDLVSGMALATGVGPSTHWNHWKTPAASAVPLTHHRLSPRHSIPGGHL